MNKRISFETPNGGSSAWFPTAWFTWGLAIGKELTFYVYDEDEYREANKTWKSYLKSIGKYKPVRK